MKKDNTIYLSHILDYIARIEASFGKTTLTGFRKNVDLQDSMIRRIEIIGEAVKQLPEEVTQPYPDIPWKQVAGMRDKLIHFYFGVDPALIWQTVCRRLPALKSTIQEMLENRAAP